MKTKNQLAQRQNDALEELEMARSKTSKMLDKNRLETLELNNTLASLNKRYNTANSKAFYWEAIVLNIKKYMLEKYQEINEVKQASWNIYLLMCKRKHIAPIIDKDDLEKQLLYVKTTLYALESIRRNAESNTKLNYRKNKNKKKKSII